MRLELALLWILSLVHGLQVTPKDGATLVKIWPLEDLKLGLHMDGKICIDGLVGQVDHELADDTEMAKVHAMSVCTEGSLNVEEPLEFSLDNEKVRGMEIVLRGIDGRDGSTTQEVSLDAWQCEVQVREPEIGAIFVNPGKVLVQVEVSKCLLGKHVELGIVYHKQDGKMLRIDGDSWECRDDLCRTTISLSKIEPGTQVFSTRLFLKDGKIAIPSKKSHSRVIMDALVEEVKPYYQRGDEAMFSSPSSSSTICKEVNSLVKKPMSIVFVGSMTLDGQKAIWKAQLERMRRRMDFDVTYVTFLGEIASEPFLQFLIEHDIFFHRVPLAYQHPETKLTQDEMILHLAFLVASLPKFTVSRNGMYRNHCMVATWEVIVFHVPNFAQDLILDMFGALAGHDILVFANSRLASDVLLVRVAEFAGVRSTVMDLPNLTPHPLIKPTVVVSPSRNTLHEPGIIDQSGYHEVIHPGINPARFSARARKVGSPHETYTIGFVARIEPEKSIGLFLHFAKRLSRHQNVKFLVIGHGSLLASMKWFAREELGLDETVLEFTGLLTGNAFPERMREIDILVNPSMTRTETFCIVNVEAMALGIPVVSFGAGGIQDYLKHGWNGLIASPPNVESLLNQVLELIRREDTQESISVNARETANALTEESMTRKYLDLYNNL